VSVLAAGSAAETWSGTDTYAKMADEMTRTGYGTGAGKQLVEALANVWFQALVFGVLLIGLGLSVGSSLAVWQWPVLLAVPLVTWLFGRWYGQFN